ncbi:hypothetical protein [Nocardia aurantia]|uniref:Uncharacterized protein n=1 Tax=Nocardia aurantia TaxID=2585199 RepID=A0A7K0DXQ2_9NOCA|nr:hypothetical protein [Nocardia aurantia]MQY30573.1 hypothetical protein [Nocardia aurantia]
MVNPYPPGPQQYPGQPWPPAPGYPAPGHGARSGAPWPVLGVVMVGLALLCFVAQSIWEIADSHHADWYLVPDVLCAVVGVVGAILVLTRPAVPAGRALAGAAAGAIFLRAINGVIGSLQFSEYEPFSHDGFWLFIPATIAAAVAIVLLALPAAPPETAPAPPPWPAPGVPPNYGAPQPYPAPGAPPPAGYQPPWPGRPQ